MKLSIQRGENYPTFSWESGPDLVELQAYPISFSGQRHPLAVFSVLRSKGFLRASLLMQCRLHLYCGWRWYGNYIFRYGSLALIGDHGTVQRFSGKAKAAF